MWLFWRLRSVPLVIVLTVAATVGFAVLGDRHAQWGTDPQQVDIPLVSFEPVLLALLFFLTQFSAMASVDALGGRRMRRRRFLLHASTLAATALLLVAVAAVLHGTADPVVIVRNYLVYVAIAVAAGQMLDELGFAVVVAYWVFCTLFGRTPQSGAQWWAVPYRPLDTTSWAVTSAWIVIVLTAGTVACHAGSIGIGSCRRPKKK